MSPLARPFAENAFRLLEQPVDAVVAEVKKPADKLASRIGSGKDDPSRMLALGPKVRSVEQVQKALMELQEPARAAVHALFFPWVYSLPHDPDGLPQALAEVTRLLRSATSPERLARLVAHCVLPSSSAAGEPDAEQERIGGYLFPEDIDIDEALGPPAPLSESETGPAPANEKGFLASLGKAPAVLSGAVLAATRLGSGRRLHASYLRTLLVEADAGESSALRRLPNANDLFEEVKDEPGAALILAWRDFVEGREGAREALIAAEKDVRLTEAERERAKVLRLRLDAAEQPEETLSQLEGLASPEAQAARGVLQLFLGNVEAASSELEAAWTRSELRPRLAPLVALCRLEAGDLAGAAQSLTEALEPQGRNASLALGRLAHAEGEIEDAVDHYRVALDDEPGPLGAWWGLAMLSQDAEERSAARAWLEEAVAKTELAVPLCEAALADGDVAEIEAWQARLPELGIHSDSDADADADTRRAQVRVLDWLGKREQAWKLRGEPEEKVRDQARGALEAGRPEEAFAQLAGLPIIDPLRRRAAKAAVSRALRRTPNVDADAVVKRVLGRVSAEEMSLLDLPSFLYRAVRELEAGQIAPAIVSLRRHLDSESDPLASRLFEVLTAPNENEAWTRLGLLLGALADSEESSRANTSKPASSSTSTSTSTSSPQPTSVDLVALVEKSTELEASIWEAAVIAAATQGLAVHPGDFEGGSPELAWAAGLMRARLALLGGDWYGVEAGLNEVAQIQSKPLPQLETALARVAAARFSEALVSDPAAVLRALEAVSMPTPAVRHDRAVWRHWLTVVSPSRTPEQFSQLFDAWEQAREAHALGHPAHPAEEKVLEAEVLNALVGLLGLVPPSEAEAVRAALVAGPPLARQALEQAGWARVETSRREQG
jgi:tetratricopeptide (TPR) repeat protein